jgi:RNA polymerase sigma factor (sigma-70 family)
VPDATRVRGSRTARAVEDLYRRHVGEVYRYAYAMLGNRADAEDVAQTTFMNALRALERGERPRKPSSWLLAIAHNVVRQRFRQAQARPIEVELSSELAGVERADESGPTIEEMLKALGRIPPLQREAIVLREFEGRAYAEIARILGITTSALETLLFRARRSLAEELEAVVTCEQAERAISRQLDKRLPRKERRRLEQHLSECPSCARFELINRRGRRAFKVLALLPVPASLTLFKGAPSAAAAAALPTIGAATSGAGAGSAVGGFVGGGIAVKAAVAVAAVGIAGGAGYTGVREIREEDSPAARRAERTETTAASATTETGAASVAGSPVAIAPSGERGSTEAANEKRRAQAKKAHVPWRTGTDRDATATPTTAELGRSPVEIEKAKHAVGGSPRANGAKKASATDHAVRSKPGKSKQGAQPRTAPQQPLKVKKQPASKKKDDPGAIDASAVKKTPPGQARRAEEPVPARAEGAVQPVEPPGKPEEPPGKPDDVGKPSGKPDETGADKKE